MGWSSNSSGTQIVTASAQPTSGAYTSGQKIYNSDQSAGFEGWVCATAGNANGNSWAPSSQYALNYEFNNGTDVYTTSTAGNSGSITPTGTGTGISASANAWGGGANYASGQQVQPTITNGLLYACTTAGFSGTVEPTWPTTSGNTVTDGVAAAWAPSTAYVVETDYANPTAGNNGWLYQCIVAGYSGTIEPTWTTTNQTYVNDDLAPAYASGNAVTLDMWVIPSAGANQYLYQCTTVGATPTMPATEPTWPTSDKATVTDANGNVWTCHQCAIWVCLQPAIWTAQTPAKFDYVAGLAIFEEFGHVGNLSQSSVSKTYTPTQTYSSLSFTISKVQRKFAVLEPQFTDFVETFEVDGSINNYQTYNTTGAPTATIGNGELDLVAPSGSSFTTIWKLNNSALRVPYVACVVDCTAMDTSAGSVYSGFVQDNNNWLLAQYDASSGKVDLSVNVAGTTTSLGSFTITLTPPFQLAAVLTHNSLTALVNTANGFEYLGTGDFSTHLDMTQVSNLSSYYPGFGGGGGANTTLTLANVSCGIWGRLGHRDENVVTYTDGSPYIVDNKVYFTQTEGSFDVIPNCHWSVWTLDLTSFQVECVSKIFFNEGGQIFGHHAGHLLVDPITKEISLAVSRWGNYDKTNSCSIAYTTTNDDLLHGVHIVTTLQTINIPTNTALYDPHMAYINGQLYVAYIETTSLHPGWFFYPCLAQAPSISSQFTIVGKDKFDSHYYEGAKIVKIGGTWYVTSASDTGVYRTYDMSMNYLGNLNAPIVPNVGSAFPHAMVIPFPQNGNTNYMMITFDGQQYKGLAQSRGNLYIMLASETETGYEFPFYV